MIFTNHLYFEPHSDVPFKHNSLFNIEDMVFSPSPAQQIMFDKLNNQITQNSFCTDSEDIGDEGKSTIL